MILSNRSFEQGLTRPSEKAPFPVKPVANLAVTDRMPATDATIDKASTIYLENKLRW